MSEAVTPTAAEAEAEVANDSSPDAVAEAVVSKAEAEADEVALCAHVPVRPASLDCGGGGGGCCCCGAIAVDFGYSSC